MEIWKTIENYPRFEVSNLGRIRVDKYKVKEWSIDTGWYISTRLRNESGTKIKSVHSLVIESFVPKPDPTLEVNHIDCNKSNNHLDNLEYVTRAENMYHALNSGRMNFIYRKGKEHHRYGKETSDEVKAKQKASHNKNGKHPNYKLTDEQVSQIKQRRFNGEGLEPLAIEFKQTITNISLICAGKRRINISPEYTIKKFMRVNK